MNRYSFDELKIGMICELEFTISSDNMEKFADITEDRNPLHIDDKYAINKGFNSRVVYGMLTGSYISTMAGMYLPGENSLIQKVEIDFIAPLYVGDHICMTGRIVSKDARFNTITVRIDCKNDKGKKVMRGIVRVSVID